jgi:hypothetical protein
MMSRVKRDIVVLEGIAQDLKRFVASHVREPVRESAPVSASDSGVLTNA